MPYSGKLYGDVSNLMLIVAFFNYIDIFSERDLLYTVFFIFRNEGLAWPILLLISVLNIFLLTL